VAHLRELNHGPRFWRLVDTLVPSVSKSVKWLADNGALLHRYAPRSRPVE
jgi:predicted metal-dependent hydrolase